MRSPILPSAEYQGTCLVLFKDPKKYNYDSGTYELTCDKRLVLFRARQDIDINGIPTVKLVSSMFLLIG